MRKIYIIGIGMGNPNTITVKGGKCISESDALIGAKRMVDSFKLDNQETAFAIAPDDILNWIEVHKEIKNISVLMSGDLGFFSGAKKLRTLVEDQYGSIWGNEQIHFEYIPGISSICYFSSAIGIAWEDAEIISLHGRDDKDISAVLNHTKTFFLTDGTDHTVRKICGRLVESGLGNVLVFVGERLSYEDERITKATALELYEKDFEPLSVMIVLNDNALYREKNTLGIRDEEFIRGNVPMTKEEVRTITVSKLNLSKNHVVYDIGAGTGSVSVEMALACPYGDIYAIETNPEGINLINENKSNFGVKNLHIIKGLAPEATENLPAADRAFIGGSKGNLDEIIKSLVTKNPEVRVVINVVALESLVEAVACIKKYGFKDIDITQINVSKAKALGHYNLMMGQNPVYIIAVQGITEAV
ncbi:precorrin-6y C5,15-methyltransferase (decarboxylating) subunit CbiE [Aminipila terrae]|uniref:Precorrin-6y C5,15-methyltransferase (Decarboxylating) subunit CbiE n=1 Tax=Aminipila terrae TaxID=2697030 RepID=A0A6P1MLU8_9FIRM|nr:precorrin-6y C5,15-methyltransferase (decarboxylating) subunit CbiE [Aminipila terrae]QHI73644.1 precorrin-6y C5,15-methyltransferase (decarboxylating) subunit CbiE [Aminipila terrae]